MAGAFGALLGSKGENAASTTMTLTTTAAVPSGGRIYCALMWAGAPTLSTFAGGAGLIWSIDIQKQSGGFNIAMVSVHAPSGLASGTTLTATFSASATHGLIAAIYLTGVPDAVPIDVEWATNTTGASTVRWQVNAMGDNDVGGVCVWASCVDNTGTSTPPIENEGTEAYDINNAAFFGALVLGYQIVGPNKNAQAVGVWSTVAGSISNNSVAVMRKDNSTPVVSGLVATMKSKKMKV